jgi:type II secretory pathway pseudopilin PulG
MIAPLPASASGSSGRRDDAESGFTLAELLITLLLVSLVLIGVLSLFDMASRTARTQTHLAEMQQSLRVAQQTLVKVVRMAGRGGLPTWDGANRIPAGIAVAVANNVPANTLIGGGANALVLDGTDVLTVRGIFATPIYQVNPAGGAFLFNPAAPDVPGTLTLAATTPSGAPQPLDAMRDAIQRVNGGATGGGTHPEALLLVSPLGDWAVVELIPGSTVTMVGTQITGAILQFQAAGGVFSAQYGALSRNGSYPPTLLTVAYAGLLEEYQYYVRDVRAVPGDAASALMPELVRARLYPNTNVAWDRAAASLADVIADNVLDLQVAFGIDLDGDGLIDESLAAGSDPTTDEWLFNAVGDSSDPDDWNTAGAAPLYYLRLTTVVRTDRATAYFEDQPLGVIEDKDYTQAPFDAYNAEWQRRYHRRQLSTTVDLRNL